MAAVRLQWRPAVSRHPGDDPDGRLRRLPDVLVVLLLAAALPHHGQLVEQHVAAQRRLPQAGQRSECVEGEGLPPAPPVLLLLALPHQQLQEDGNEAQFQAQLLPCAAVRK